MGGRNNGGGGKGEQGFDTERGKRRSWLIRWFWAISRRWASKGPPPKKRKGGKAGRWSLSIANAGGQWRGGKRGRDGTSLRQVQEGELGSGRGGGDDCPFQRTLCREGRGGEGGGVGLSLVRERGGEIWGRDLRHSPKLKGESLA